MFFSSFCEAVVGNDLIHAVSPPSGFGDALVRQRRGQGGATAVPCYSSEGDSSVVLFKSSQDMTFESVGLNAVVGSHDAPKMARVIQCAPFLPSISCTLGTSPD